MVSGFGEIIRLLSLRLFRRLGRNEVANLVVERCAKPYPPLRIRDEFEVADALRYMESGRHFGKIVVRF